MANLGQFSPLLRDIAWFDQLVIPEGWYEGDLILTAPLVSTPAGNVTVVVTAGSVVWTGQTVNVTIASVVPVTPGSVTWQGQTVNTVLTVPVSPAVVNWAGQT